MAQDRCLRLYVFAVFNKIVLGMGCGLFGMGLWLMYSNSAKIIFETKDLNSGPFIWGARLLIGLGSVMATVATYGERAICKNDIKFMRVLAILLAVLVVAEPVVGGIVYYKREETGELLTNFYTKVIEHYDEDPQIAEVLRNFHTKLECCGVSSPPMDKIKKICRDPRDQACTELISQFFGSEALMLFGIIGIEAVLITALVCTVILVKRGRERERERQRERDRERENPRMPFLLRIRSFLPKTIAGDSTSTSEFS